jgi:hypothetical protein
MAMSGNILREIVGATFKVDPTKIKLSGVLTPNHTFVSYEGHSWATGYDMVKVFGFNAKDGFKEYLVPSYYSQNGERIGDDCPQNIYEIAGDSCEDIFFLVQEESCDQNGNEQSSFTLYKAPKFKEYFKKITSEDIARWEQWLKE